MTSRIDAGMDTPVSPLPEAAPPAATSRRGRRGRRGAVAATAGGSPLRAGIGHVLASWRVLVFVLVVQLLLGLTVVIPFWQGVASRLDHHPHAAALAGSPTPHDRALGWEAGMNPGIWRDIEREQTSLFAGLTVTHFWIAVIAWLFGALAAGGFLGTAVSGENPVGVGAFLSHGARVYGPMLRVGLCFGLAYYIVARIVLEAWGGGVKPDEFMSSSETSGWWGDRLRELVMVICFFWFRIAADLARAHLVVYGKRGAVGAFFRGLGRALRPKPVLLALAIGAPVFLVLLGLGYLAQALTGDDGWILGALFVVVQLAVLLRWSSRAALLAAYAKSA